MHFDQESMLTTLSSPVVVWFVFGLFLLGYAIISIVLVYHWKKYGHTNKHIALAEVIYFPVSLILICLISFALFMYATL